LVLAADAFVGGELAALLGRLGSKRLGSNLASTLFLDGSVLAEIDLKCETLSHNWRRMRKLTFWPLLGAVGDMVYVVLAMCEENGFNVGNG
jgi:hypothetical protein